VEALAWWLIPITATLLAVIWVTWRNRPRRPADAHETLAAHRRFTAALERTEQRETPPSAASAAATGAADSGSSARSA
jgi:hypothetical protein